MDTGVVDVLFALPTSYDRIVLGKIICPILHVLLEAGERRLKGYFFIFQSPGWVFMMICASNLGMSTSISGFLAANIITKFAQTGTSYIFQSVCLDAFIRFIQCFHSELHLSFGRFLSKLADCMHILFLLLILYPLHPTAIVSNSHLP